MYLISPLQVSHLTLLSIGPLKKKKKKKKKDANKLEISLPSSAQTAYCLYSLIFPNTLAPIKTSHLSLSNSHSFKKQLKKKKRSPFANDTSYCALIPSVRAINTIYKNIIHIFFMHIHL